MIRDIFAFPQHNVESIFFLLAVTVLVLIVGFPLFEPPRENGRCRFPTFNILYFLATDLLLSPLVRTFLPFYIPFIENHQNICFLICLPPGRRLLLTPGMGMGGGPFGTILGPFYDPLCTSPKKESTKNRFP